MEEQRRSPEKILAQVKEQESAAARGKLKIFLGMAAGVGKTYSMLQSAQELKSEGEDVVAGVVVTHGRRETDALTTGLEFISEAEVEYKGVRMKELDLDGVLKRKPEVVLIDELAHTNAPGCRHQKRWQDVQEILQAGIDVFSTLNIQHLESMNDVVAQVTGVNVRETVPDSIFESAYEIELIDLPPDELIQRLREGKVYLPENTMTALENFFKKGNLIALREMALRLAAQRVDAQMLRYREASAVKNVWAVSDRLLVCVGPSPLSARLVRATKRMAGSLKAEWLAVYVETPSSARLSERDRNRVIRTLQLAQRLGAETARISGTNTADELVRYAQKRNVSKVIIGKPARPRWREVLLGSVVDELIRRSGNIDVYVISGDKNTADNAPARYKAQPVSFKPYIYSILIVGVATWFVRLAFHHLATVNLAMLYQLAVVFIAVRYGTGPSIVASFLAVGAFDFFFIPPYLSFSVSDTQYVITFAVMLVVGLALSTLTSTVKKQAELFRMRERQTAALYAMTREQATAQATEAVVDISLKHITDVFECTVATWLSTTDQELRLLQTSAPQFNVDSKETGVAQWVLINQQPAGAGTTTLSGARGLYLPLVGTRGAIGVLGIVAQSIERFGNPDEMHLLETFVNQMALAIERAQLSEHALGGRRQLRIT